MRYIVQYTATHQRRIRIGIEAESPQEAIKKAGALHDEGDMMQDTAEVPLLFDDEEDSSPSFSFEQALPADAPWPEPYGHVNSRHQRQAAFQVGKLLIEAYRRGEARGGSIDWDELDLAYQAALEAGCN